jgi:cytoskeletal protein RodZ
MKQTSIGERLRQAREAKSATLYDASKETRIRVDYLQSMERDSFHFVTGETYVKGMLRSYARWLGIDAGEVVGEYERVHGGAPPISLQEVLKPPAQPPRSRRRRWEIAGVVAAAILLPLSVVSLMSPSNVAEPPPSVGTQTTQPQGTRSPSPPAVAQALPQDVDVTVSITGEKCWLRVLADGNETKPAFEGTLRSGAVQTYHAADVIEVTFGDMGSVDVTANGTHLGTPGGQGEVGRFVFNPDTESFIPS